MATVGADREASGDHQMAFGAIFCGRFAVTICARLLGADLVYRPMTRDVATKVEHQAVLLAWIEAKSSPHHLIIEPGRESRTHYGNAVDIGRVETGCQYINVHQVS